AKFHRGGSSGGRGSRDGSVDAPGHATRPPHRSDVPRVRVVARADASRGTHRLARHAGAVRLAGGRTQHDARQCHRPASGAGPPEDRFVGSRQTDPHGTRRGIFSASGAVVMPRLRSLRTTVTLWHMSALLIVLLAYAVAVFVFVRRNLSSALDERLGDDLEWAAAFIKSG